MRLIWLLPVVVLAGCATPPNPKCEYEARPVRCAKGSSIDPVNGMLTVFGPACSKVQLRFQQCGSAVPNQWMENDTGQLGTGKSAGGCLIEIVKGSCLQYPPRPAAVP